MKISRKDFLASGTKYAAGAVVGAAMVDGLVSNAKAGILAAWPYPYQTLDPEKVRILGHDLYYARGCSYGTFAALSTAAKDVIGEPWTSFPSEIMVYGGGGGAGWGGTCGAINGAAAFISLVMSGADATVLESEVYGWYTQTKLPTDISNQYGREQKYTQNKYTQDLLQNISGSILCHASIAEWCKAAKFAESSTERKERCARLTGDVAAYTAKVLNDKFASTFSPLFVTPTILAECKMCHGATITAKMECTQCHGDHRVGTTQVEELGGVPVGYELENNYPNPFNPRTRIQFSIPAAATVDLAIYDIHGRLVRNLLASEHRESGRYAIEWDGKDNAGGKVGTGSYFCRMQAGGFSATKKLSLLK
ncbi:MAG: C-GCAxxG-C-C family (seleno)protein [Bacteroidota bacterium]